MSTHAPKPSDGPYRGPPAREPLSVHPRGPGAREIAIVVFGTPPLLLAGAFVLGLVGAVGRATGLGTAGGAAVFLAAGVALSLLYRRKHTGSTDRAEIHEDGARIVEGVRDRFVRWSEVTEVRIAVTRTRARGETSIQRYDVTVVTADDEVILTRLYQRIEALAATITAEVAACLVPTVVGRVSKGEKVAWYPLSLRRDGIRFGSDTIAWSEARTRVEAVTSGLARGGVTHLEDDLILEDDRGEIGRVRFQEVTNACFLPAVIAGMREQAGKRRGKRRGAVEDGAT